MLAAGGAKYYVRFVHYFFMRVPNTTETAKLPYAVFVYLDVGNDINEMMVWCRINIRGLWSVDNLLFAVFRFDRHEDCALFVLFFS